MARFRLILWLAGVLLLTSLQSGQAGMSERSGREIEHLLAFIDASDCLFLRNGKEHSAQEAGRHIRRKFEAVKKRITTAEDFITFAASRSSISGDVYLVRCGEQTTPTSHWLTSELNNFRQDFP